MNKEFVIISERKVSGGIRVLVSCLNAHRFEVGMGEYKHKKINCAICRTNRRGPYRVKEKA